MSYLYTYEIIKVDEVSRCMDIVYSAPDCPTVHVGARLPYENETLEAIIEMYSPVRYWEEQKLKLNIPKVGTTGKIFKEDLSQKETPAIGRIPITHLGDDNG